MLVTCITWVLFSSGQFDEFRHSSVIEDMMFTDFLEIGGIPEGYSGYPVEWAGVCK